jgi:CO dehydrogenase/acetyl-CoA synthase epsilon subunit
MSEQHTLEILGLALTRDEHIAAVYDAIIAEDSVIFGFQVYDLDRVMQDLGKDFRVKLVATAISTPYALNTKLTAAVEGKAWEHAQLLVDSVKDAF